MILTEAKMTELIEGLTTDDKAIPYSEVGNMRIMLNNQAQELQNQLSEGTISSDVQQFVPIFLPLVRRVMPRLIANELVGIQPLTTPTGYIFAINFRYTGNSVNSAKPTKLGLL